MKKEIRHVHFQITRNCNLRCEFCGQWGKNGFFREASGDEMTFPDTELDHKNVTIMSVITDSLIAELPEFLNELNKLNIRELLWILKYIAHSFWRGGVKMYPNVLGITKRADRFVTNRCRDGWGCASQLLMIALILLKSDITRDTIFKN